MFVVLGIIIAPNLEETPARAIVDIESTFIIRDKIKWCRNAPKGKKKRRRKKKHRRNRDRSRSGSRERRKEKKRLKREKTERKVRSAFNSAVEFKLR